jgi:Cytochrome P450
LSRQYWKEKKLLKSFGKFFEKVVDSMRIQSIEKSINNNEQKQKKFIDLLLEDKNEFSASDVVDHVKAIVYGVWYIWFSYFELKIHQINFQGYDTSTSTIAAALMMLAMHKNIQEKAFNDTKSFFESFDDEMTLQDLNNLPYIEMVLKETMRLFPAASMVGRYSTGSVQLGRILEF